MTSLWIFVYGNTLYQANMSARTETARTAYANYAAAAVRRYAGKGHMFEIWNEPNGKFWNPTPNVLEYAAMANQALDTIKNETTSEVIVGTFVMNNSSSRSCSCWRGCYLP